MKQLLFASIFIFNLSLFAQQSLSTQLGAIQTRFKFTSGTKELKINHQFISKTGKYFYKYSEYENKSFGYAAGYESLNLEFACIVDLSSEVDKYYFNKYLIRFYDENNSLITSIHFDPDRVKRVVNTEEVDGLYYYSFDLVDVPIIVLDNTKTMDITYLKRR